MHLQSPFWIVLGDSVVGTGHIAYAIPCQDAHSGAILGDGTLILAVADGAGSAIHSAQGSLRAAQSSVQFLANYLAARQPSDDQAWRDLLRQTLTHAREQLEELAGEIEGASLRDLATTLLLAVANDTHLATLQLGDGAIVLRSLSGALDVLSLPPSGEYINETTFLTSSDPLSDALITTRPIAAVDALSLFTDGVQFLALDYATNSAHAPFFGPLFDFAAHPEANPEELSTMLASDRVNERTDDDKTLVLAVRTRSSGAA